MAKMKPDGLARPSEEPDAPRDLHGQLLMFTDWPARRAHVARVHEEIDALEKDIQTTLGLDKEDNA